MSTAFRTDRYEFTMLDSFVPGAKELEELLKSGSLKKKARFEVFSRRLPKGRRYGVLAGVGPLLDKIENFKLTPEQIKYLRQEKVVGEATLHWLKDFKFTGNIDGYREGDVYFANSPVLSVEAEFGQAVVLETLILSTLNYSSAVASAASRMVTAANGKPVAEFGGRRTHDEAAVDAARAAYIGGFSATSNLEAGLRYGIPTVGTAAHAYILAHESEFEAFRKQLQAQGPQTTLLVDTYSTALGIRNALRAAHSLGLPGPGAVRLDSGDYLEESRAARERLDVAGATDTKIVLTGSLDEFEIERLEKAGAPIDSYAVGTALVTGSGAPTAEFVYKLVAIESSRNPSGPLRAVSKHSLGKATVGGEKLMSRQYSEGKIAGEEAQVNIMDEFDFGTSLPSGRFPEVPLIVAGKRWDFHTASEAREFHTQTKTELSAEDRKIEPGEPSVAVTYKVFRPFSRKAIIVVDVQNDFCEGGSLAVSGGAAAAKRISKYLASQPEDVVIVATKDFHVDPGEHWALKGKAPNFSTTWPVHCVANQPGSEFHPNLDTTRISKTFYKGAREAAYSGFEAVDDPDQALGESLADFLRTQGVTDIEVVGIATDHCVRATAIDGIRNGFNTTVNLRLCAGVAKDSTRAAVGEMKGMGIGIARMNS